MSCEQPKDISIAIADIYKKVKNEYLKNPETFLYGVVRDAHSMGEVVNRSFWIKTFTESGGVAMMDEKELGALIASVQNYLGTEEGMKYYPQDCQEVLTHLKTIADARKGSCLKSGPDDGICWGKLKYHGYHEYHVYHVGNFARSHLEYSRRDLRVKILKGRRWR